MKFHLQLFPPKLLGCDRAAGAIYSGSGGSLFLHKPILIVVIPLGIIVLALVIAAIPHKRKVTPEEFADELERHLLGTEREWDWDDTTSVGIADERLERIRWEFPKFDSLTSEKDKDELRAIIVALRRGEMPEIVPPTYLTYGS